jgi:hypothetical protein
MSATIGKAHRDRNVLPAPVMIATLPASRAHRIPGDVASERKDQHAGDHDGMAAVRRVDGR